MVVFAGGRFGCCGKARSSWVKVSGRMVISRSGCCLRDKKWKNPKNSCVYGLQG